MLFWQQTTFALHELPVPTPMTVMGEQSRPTSASTPWRTMPSRPRRSDVAGSLAYYGACAARVSDGMDNR